MCPSVSSKRRFLILIGSCDNVMMMLSEKERERVYVNVNVAGKDKTEPHDDH